MISYKPLKKFLIDNNMKMQQLRDDGILNPNIAARMNGDKGYVNLSTIDNLCNHLTQRLGKVVEVTDIIEFTPDEPLPEQQTTND